MQDSTPARLQFSLQEILAWTTVLALALSLFMIWEFPWLAVLSIGVGGYLVETIGRRRAKDVQRFGDWLGLFAGFLLLGSGPYVAMVEGNASSTWGLPLVMPIAPVLYRIPGWTIRHFRSPEALAIGVVAILFFYSIFTGLTLWRPKLRWVCALLILIGCAVNFLTFGVFIVLTT